MRKTHDHMATKGTDSCRLFHVNDQQQHEIVVNNGGKCYHTHSSWGVCEECRFENLGIHRKHISNV